MKTAHILESLFETTYKKENYTSCMGQCFNSLGLWDSVKSS